MAMGDDRAKPRSIRELGVLDTVSEAHAPPRDLGDLGILDTIFRTRIDDPSAPRAQSRDLTSSGTLVKPVRIGHFTVLRKLGQGGMGDVYACYDEMLDRKVAVKVHRLTMVRDRELASARLIREGQALARLAHPNVVTVYEVGGSSAGVYVAMEFVRGRTLEEWAGQGRDWREILDMFDQAGRGLAAAHAVGIVHRDVKPQNVLVDEGGRVKVLDFGLALTTGPEEVDADANESRVTASMPMPSLTATGALAGTPAYMSPEQYLGQSVTASSDQYSFCVSLYQCLYGGLPFSATSIAQLRMDIVEGRIVEPDKRSVPGWVYKCLRRGMSTDPADRYGSMDALLAALDRRRTTRRISGAVLGATVAGILGFAVARSSSQVEICPDAGRELTDIWDEDRSAKVAAAVATSPSPYAGKFVQHVLPQLDQYADTWITQRNEACLAHAEGRQAERLFERRIACLDQRRAGLQAAVDVLESAESDPLEAAGQAVFALPSLTRCSDADALLAEVEPPEDSELRERVQTHRESLARANVLKYAGKVQAGIDLLDDISADEDAMAYLPLAAEVELHRGFLQFAMNDVAAEDSYEKSMHMAVKAGHLKAAAQASSRLAYFRAEILGKLDRVNADLPLVEALNSHVESDVDLFAEHLNNLGWIRSLLGDRQEGTELLEKADALRKKHNRAQTPLAVGTLFNLGRLAEDAGQHARAVEIYRSAISRSGQLGPWVKLRFEGYIAVGSIELGKLSEARKKYQRLLNEAVSTNDHAHRATILFFMARCELRDGNALLAREFVEQGARGYPKDSIRYDLYHNLIMKVAAASGDSESVQALYEEAQQRLDKSPDPTGRRRSKLLLAYGNSLTDLGRPDEALLQLQKLRSSLSNQVVAIEPAIAPRLSLALGRAYREIGDFGAAKSALEQALSQYGEGWPIERADTLYELGLAAYGQRQLGEAARLLTEAESLYTVTADADFLPLAKARFARAQVLTTDLGAVSDGAREAAQSALEVFRAKNQADDVAAVEAWLARFQ